MRKATPIILLAAALSVPAAAWEPVTQQAVVTTAMHVLTKDGVLQLSKLERDVREGASAPPEMIEDLYPGLATGKVRAIENEMHLLAAVRAGGGVAPYYAYRLGALGRLVAEITAPLADEPTVYRERYYADVAANFRQVPLKLSQRKLVDPLPYFERVKGQANSRRDLILRDYQEGIGFTGVARAALSDDYSRSVAAVADVWSTVVTSGVVHAGVSEVQLRDYILNAMAYYVARRNPLDIDSNQQRLARLVPSTPDLDKRIGDMFFEAGYFDRAIRQYNNVLRAQPARRDVVEKLALYYMRMGNEALEEERLEAAHDAYAKALEVDPLHTEAEAKRLEAGRLIAQRDTRLETARRLIQEAGQLETDAERLAIRDRYADAIDVLKNARDRYEDVSNEFAAEFRAAAAGLTNIDFRLRELKGGLVQNAQRLSGGGLTLELQQLAARNTRELDQRALHKLTSNALEAEVDRLMAAYQSALEIR